MKNKKILIIALLLFIAFKASFAQQSNTMYFMDWVPQSNSLNPAKQPTFNLHVGIPVTNFHTYAGNSALSISDILLPQSDGTLSWAFNNKTNRDILMKNFHKVNYLSTYFQDNIISFGFRAGFDPDLYFNFDYSTKIESIISFPGDLMKFSVEQQFLPNNTTQSWKGLGINNVWYNELALGVSKIIDNQWTLGIRPKLLFGKANTVLKCKQLDITSNMSVLEMETDIRGHISLPSWANVDTFRIALTDSTVQFDADPTTDELINSVISPKNFGFGIDIGAVYAPSNELELSASILDLGFIRWGNNTYNAHILTTDDPYEFTGLETTIKDFMNNDSSELLSSLIDSITNKFTPEENYDPYWQALSGKLYLGARYNINEKISFGLLSVSRLYQGRVRQSVTISSNFNVIRNFSTSISYSMSNHTYNNLGLGMGLGIWPFNLYFIMDKVPVEINSSLPVNMQYFNFRFGMNVIIGVGKKIKDIPMIE